MWPEVQVDKVLTTGIACSTVERTGMLDVVILGCGRVAKEVHLKNLDKIANCQVAGLIDPDPHARAQAGALAPAAYRCNSLSDFLERASAQAAIVSAPPSHHLELVRQCLQNGLAVYVEKPLAASLDDGLEMVRLAQETELPTMVGFNLRRRAVFLELQEALREEKAGEIRLVRSSFSIPETGATWRGCPGGGVLVELASHHIDLISHLFGRPFHKVLSAGFPPGREEKTWSFTLELEGGVPVQCHFDLESTLENRLEVFGSRATLVADRFRNLVLKSHGPSRGPRSLLSLPRIEWFQRLADELRHPWGDHSYFDSLNHFCECVLTGAQASPSFEDGLSSLKVIQELLAAQKIV